MTEMEGRVAPTIYCKNLNDFLHLGQLVVTNTQYMLVTLNVNGLSNNSAVLDPQTMQESEMRLTKL
jgi:hypothetical protein